MDIKNQRGLTTFWGISIILMVSLVIIFVFYILYFFWIENPVPTSEITIVRAVRHQSVSIPSKVDTTGWLTFENSGYGVRFQFPVTLAPSEDDIIYGSTSGRIVSLRDATGEQFSLRVFMAKADETIPTAFQRITGIDPSAYQSFNEEVGDEEAIIYRQKAGTLNNDRIYFIHGKYFYEVPFSTSTVNILSTFKFL